MDPITAQFLAARQGERFVIADIDFTLTEVLDQSTPGAGGLTAVFTAAEPHGIAQGIEVISHEKFSDSEMFVVPTSPRELSVTFTWLAPQV